MPCTEAYKEHIMYTFNGFCKTVIRFAAINAWRDRSRRRQKEISLEYLTEEKFYPFSTTDKYFLDPCKQYPVTICGQSDSAYRQLKKFLSEAGLPNIRFHDLRHTFATLALQNGVDIKTVSGMLGHYSAGFTLDTYTHVTTSAKKEAANTMGSILSGALR